MANDDSELNQDINSGTSFSPAHKHLQDDSPEAITSAKNDRAALDRLGMESAKRAGNRFKRNAERIPSDTTFTK